jgi:hypothetical protein
MAAYHCEDLGVTYLQTGVWKKLGRTRTKRRRIRRMMKA